MTAFTFADVAFVAPPAAPTLNLTLVQSQGAGAGPGGGAVTATATLAAGATAGNLLVAACMISASFASTATMIGPSGYSQAVALDGGNQIVAIYYLMAAGGETAASVSENTSQSAISNIELMEFTGATSYTLDKTATNNPSSGVNPCPTGSTGVLTAAPGLAVAIVAGSADITGKSWDSGFNLVDHAPSPNRSVVGYEVVTSTSALNPQGTATGGNDLCACIATFQLA